MPDNWTGERLETFVYSEVTIEHLHRYAVALQYANSKTVLDIACGEGYGSNLLATVAKQVVGVDISAETIEAAKIKYKPGNLDFICGSTSGIPAADNYFDVVVSYETIEHHNEHDKMMQEIKRVLKKDGLLIISSPDKKFYTDKRNYKNPFHIKELYFQDFKQLVLNYFSNVHCFFQNNIVGSFIIPEDFELASSKCYSGDYSHIKSEKFEPMYNVCIASDKSLPSKELSFFNGFDIQRMLSELKTNEIVNARINEMKNVYENSWSYKIGRIITLPYRALKKRNTE